MSTAVMRALRFVVEPVLFLTFMTMYMEMSVVQQLIIRKVCLTEFSDCEHQNKTTLDAAATPYMTAYNTEMSLITLLISPWFGSWADKYGRKRLMIVPSIGSILSTLNFVAASYFIKTTPVFVVFVSSALIGLSSGTLGVSATCFGLVSDVTSVERRSTRIAVLEAMIFTGGAAGFVIVGFMVPRVGFVYTFALELAVHCGILAYIVFVVREPERAPHRRELSTMSLFSVQHVLSIGRAVARPRAHNYRLVLGLLLASALMLSYGMAATSYLTLLFLREPPLAWSDHDYSYYHGLLIAVQGCAIVAGLPLCLRLLRMKDSTAGLLGGLSRMIGLGWLSLATRSWMVYFSVVLLSLSEFMMPSIRSIISKIVGPNEKAQLFACISAIQSFAFLTGSLMFLGLFPLTRTLFTGFGFALAASFQLFPVATFVYLHFALDVKELLLPICAENSDEIARYESTEDSVPTTTES